MLYISYGVVAGTAPDNDLPSIPVNRATVLGCGREWLRETEADSIENMQRVTPCWAETVGATRRHPWARHVTTLIVVK